jgi:hypothetical protein
MMVDTGTAEATVSVKIPIELYQQFEAYCVRHGLTTNQGVILSIWDELSLEDAYKRAKRRGPAPGSIEPTTEYTVEEVIERCRDEWVLMQVTGLDDRHRPARGVVLAHSFVRADISWRLAEEPPRNNQPDAVNRPYYIFRALPRIETRAELERAIAELDADVGDQPVMTEDSGRAFERQ